MVGLPIVVPILVDRRQKVSKQWSAVGPGVLSLLGRCIPEETRMLNDSHDPDPDRAWIAAERARNGGRVHHLEPVPGELPELAGLELDAPADFVPKRLAHRLLRDPIVARENQSFADRNERDSAPCRTGD
jgi:hypothetical protein